MLWSCAQDDFPTTVWTVTTRFSVWLAHSTNAQHTPDWWAGTGPEAY